MGFAPPLMAGGSQPVHRRLRREPPSLLAIFVLTIAGIRRRVVQIKAIEKYGFLRL